MSTIKFKVTVTAVPNTGELHPVDAEEGPSGEYVYVVEAGCMEDAQELGLDRFHSSVPIKVLEDYDITAVVEEA